jgi:hypothetical protein
MGRKWCFMAYSHWQSAIKDFFGISKHCDMQLGVSVLQAISSSGC